ncbi:MAG TPA: anthranilate synthase component I family protein [Bacilli bacterium]
MLPYVIKFPLESHGAASWEEAWKQAQDCAFVLESGKSGRYTFLGLNPDSTIQGRGTQAQLDYRDGTPPIHVEGNPLELVREWMKPFQSPKVEGAPKFIGGCAGYWGYDVVRTIEKIEPRISGGIQIPDYYFMMINQLWIRDLQENELYCAIHVPVPTSTSSSTTKSLALQEQYDITGQSALEMKKLWDKIMSAEQDNSGYTTSQMREQTFQSHILNNDIQIDIEAIEGIQTSLSKDEYMRAVLQVQEYIRQGDVFQVNLAVRQSRAIETAAEDVYEWLRLSNPSPYMGFMRFPDFQIVSASPELLVRVEGNQVMARPIAGTRPRGIDAQEDKELAADLIQSDKERAEHIMLVDLERNDLGRISRYGSVKVEDFMVIEYYSHVMHIVSQVQGELQEDKDAFDVIAAVFPGGTITGAPKIRTMEIIEELETVRRGPYTGSIGWIDYNGNMEFNIVIRTLIVHEGQGYIQAGAGIVIDSDPEHEYYESLNKAKALWKAIQYSEKGLLP